MGLLDPRAYREGAHQMVLPTARLRFTCHLDADGVTEKTLTQGLRVLLSVDSPRQ